MNRYGSWITRAGLAASLLLGLSVFPEGRLGTISKAHAEANGSCSVATLNGAYGFYRTGTTPSGPVAAVGITTLDGNGSATTRATVRRNGVTVQDLFTTPAGENSYEVDPDCTGRLVMSDGTVFSHIVVLDQGRELFFISLSDALTIYGVAKKIDKD